MYIVTKNYQTVQYEERKDSLATGEDRDGHRDTGKKSVHCEVLTDRGENVEDSSGHIDIEQRHGI